MKEAPGRNAFGAFFIKRNNITMKQYINLALAKKQCNIDTDFTDDDTYVEWLIEVALATVQVDLCCPLEAFEDENGKLPAPICHAALLYIGDLYANREVNAYTNVTSVPFGYRYLLDLYHCYADVTSEKYVNDVLADVISRLEIEKSTGRLILHRDPDGYDGLKGKVKKMTEDSLLVDAGNLYLEKNNN